MNFSPTFIRRLHWLHLPGAFLIALLQRTPVLRVASTAGEITRASPVGAMLRAAVATAASLGALHSLAGATTLSVSSGAATGVSGKVGAQLGPIAMGTIGTLAQPLSWGISGTIPAGLRFLSSSGASLTTAGTLNTPNGVMLLTGTPTAPAGIYALTLVAYQGVNRTLIASPSYTYSIVITGGVVAATSITTQPASLVMVSGSTAVFSVVATGAPTYQWLKYGVALAGATNRTLVVPATAETVGSYSVVVTDALLSGTSASATLSLATTAEISRLINLSILTNISAADPDFTMGTVLGGTGTSGNKPLLVRAVGPSLGALGVPGTLDDP